MPLPAVPASVSRLLVVLVAAGGVLSVWALVLGESLLTPVALAATTVLLAAWLADRAFVLVRSRGDLAKQERLLQVIDVLPWGLLLTREGSILHANPAAHRLLGDASGAIRGRAFLDLVEPGDRDAVEAWLAKSQHDEPVRPCTTFLHGLDGKPRPVRLHGAYVSYGGHRTFEVLLSDRSAEYAAQTEVERLASFPRFNPEPIVEVADDGTVRFANEAALRLLPRLMDEQSAHPFLHRLPALREALQAGAPVAEAVVEIDGRTYEQVASISPDGHALRVYGRDVTQRERMLRELQSSEDRFSRLFRFSPVAMSLSRLADGVLLDVNESFVRLLGYPSAEDLIGQKTTEVVWESEQARESLVAELQREGRMAARLITIRSQAGVVRRVIASAEVIEVEGEPCIAGMVIDVEEQERLRARVEEERDFALSIVETAGMGLLISDPDFKVRFVNKRLLEMSGYTAEEAQGLDPTVFMHPDDRQALLEERPQRLKDGRERVFETQMLCKDGTARDVLVAIVPRIEDGQYTGSTSVVLDISEQREAIREVKRLRFFYENILHDLPISVAVMDQEGRFLFLNRQAMPDPEVRETLIGHTVLEYAHRVGRPVERYARRQAWIEEVVRTKQEGRLEESFEYDGHPVFRQGVARPVLDADGEVAYVVGFGLDVTERKLSEAELIRARDRAEELSELKSSFIANMSHEVRTPLTAVIGFAEVLQEEVATPELREVATLIRESGARLLETLNSVLDLARMQAGAIEVRLNPMPLMPPLKTTVDLFRPLAERKGLRLGFETPLEPVFARIDVPAFNRIMNNLLSNAIKFTDEGGVRVMLAETEGQVFVRVSDTGRGIDTLFLERVFEEFQQESSGLSRSHTGSGLGLAIARRLAELMGGTITVESVKGEGSTFTLTLPALGADAS